MNYKHLILAFLTFIITACQSDFELSDNKDFDSKNAYAFAMLIDQFANNIEQIWSKKEVITPKPKDYVTYSENLKTRVHINYTSGKITIETIEKNATQTLNNAIIATLLASDPNTIFLAKDDFMQLEPFLYKQVRDNHGEFIKWDWRAKQFAEYLALNKVKKRSANKQTIYYVDIPLVKNHTNERAYKYLSLIKKTAKKYHINEKLILAIIEIESNFNPYAVSKSDAIGLMQVQQHTAGRDMFRIWGKTGEPSRQYLFNATNNIEIGTAYLAHVRDKYLDGIKNPLSMHYAVISAYNGGAGNVLDTFNKDRIKAIKVINSLTPNEVFSTLISAHNLIETRHYLIKVNRILNTNRY